MATILWRRIDAPGMDRCTFEETADGHRIAGTALVALANDHYEIRYSVILDRAWRTRTVGAHVHAETGDRRLALNADGEGSWSVADDPILGLYGAIDIDLSWTPATNTIALRRLSLAPGQTADVVAALIQFPGHDVVRTSQSYERLSANVVRYRSGDYQADLEVDADDIVLHYPDGWEAVEVAT